MRMYGIEIDAKLCYHITSLILVYIYGVRFTVIWERTTLAVWGSGVQVPYAPPKQNPHLSTTSVGSFQLSVPCGTISTPSVREAMLRIVKCLRA